MPRTTAAMAAAGRTLAEPRLSSDGRHLAFLATAGGAAQVVVVDLEDGVEVVVTTEPGPTPSRSYGGGSFDWLPDGSGIVYAGATGGLWRQDREGGAPRELPTAGLGRIACPAVSPDGTRVAFVVDTRTVAVTSTDPDGPWPVCLSATADFAMDPAWSPDGRSVAWHEWDVPHMPWDESRIVVRDADASTEPKVVAGGPDVSVSQPRWSSAGELGFVDDTSGWWNVVAGDVRIDEELEHAGPTWGPGERTWCWSPDGSSVAYTRNEDGFGSLHVRVLRTGEDRRLGRAVHGALSWGGGTIASLRSGGVTPTSSASCRRKPASSSPWTPHLVWWIRTISRVPSARCDSASERMTSSVTTPPALRMTWASPFCRPSTAVTSSRASMQATTASPLAGGPARSWSVKPSA